MIEENGKKIKSICTYIRNQISKKPLDKISNILREIGRDIVYSTRPI